MIHFINYIRSKNSGSLFPFIHALIDFSWCPAWCVVWCVINLRFAYYYTGILLVYLDHGSPL